MGLPDAKVLLLTALLPFALPPMAMADKDEAGAAATLENYILPEYKQSDNRLQFVLYGEKAVNLGAFINLFNPHVDIVQDNIKDVNEVGDLRNVKLYPLGEASAKIKEFWKEKSHSRALVASPDAVYDKTTKTLKGDKTVNFRSREMDIDGIGFDADYSRKFIHVRSDVKVFLRGETREKAEASAKAKDGEAKKDPLKSPKRRNSEAPTIITSDSMDVDIVNNVAIFTGNVDVDDPDMNIKCQKMTIYLENSKKDVEKPPEEPKDMESEVGEKQLSKVECVGKVVIVRKLKDASGKLDSSQRALAGKAEYDFRSGGKITLEEDPVIIKDKDKIAGEKIILYRDSERMQVVRGTIKTSGSEGKSQEGSGEQATDKKGD